jgi:D-arabinose 5-phosphate isomerase GutQ
MFVFYLFQARTLVFAVTGDEGSPLAAAAQWHVHAPATSELLGCVPTRSIMSQEAVANGILTAVVATDSISTADFKRFHPGGAIGSNPRLM